MLRVSRSLVSSSSHPPLVITFVQRGGKKRRKSVELDRAQRLRKTRSRFTFRLASPRSRDQTMRSRRENESRLRETRSRRGQEKCSSLLLSSPSHLSAAPPRWLLSSTREIKIRSLPLTAVRTTSSRYFQPDLDDRCFVHIRVRIAHTDRGTVSPNVR